MSKMWRRIAWTWRFDPLRITPGWLEHRAIMQVLDRLEEIHIGLDAEIAVFETWVGQHAGGDPPTEPVCAALAPRWGLLQVWMMPWCTYLFSGALYFFMCSSVRSSTFIPSSPRSMFRLRFM